MKLNKKQSAIFTAIYVLITLGFRFYIEPLLGGHYLISIGIGLYFILLYWVLLKKRFLNFQNGNAATPGS
ncbi:MAG: hypothetical protein D8M58_20165 [Calditrichaeota bacterium]|nr:MAG: hypothetical protein DWQ03_14150 [Calditrichota bacterium]MBL1207726.1 hypothetical protein [Calditrichota bacterium]NOG47560.1 hypothetical protein [Calditrichota bacterium]